MKTKQIIFIIAGLLAGLIVVAIKSIGPVEIAIMSLTWFVGPLFFVATLAGIVMTDAGRCFKPDSGDTSVGWRFA